MKPSAAFATLASIALVALAPTMAHAADLGELRAERSVARTCAEELHAPEAAGIARTDWVAPATGKATVELRGGRAPDWDLVLFRDRRPVAASTSFTSIESAAAWVRAGDRIEIQACRRSGGRGSVGLSAELYQPPPAPVREPRIALVSVQVPTAAELARLERLGLDVTHDVGGGEATVVTYSAAERTTLASHGFAYETLVRDLVAADAAARAREQQARGESRLPSGRTSYREYVDYTDDMKALAAANPALVRSIQIGTTFEGRPIEGVEIAEDVAATDDGRPVYLNFGAHHAREWPSAEMPVEFALDLVERYNANDPRVRALLAEVRVVIVPIVNVDGFIASRSFGFNPATDDDANLTIGMAVANQAAYIRKNCRPTGPGDDAIPCENRTFSGVDLNRNYGAYWGGPGSSDDPTSQSYRGTEAFSEPESQAVHEFTAKLHPTVFITNHTFTDGRWLRQPGFDAPFLPQVPVPGYTTGDCGDVAADGGAITPDEAAMDDLGDDMAAASEPDWISELGYETLCDITGATEDWNYFSQGTYGYTPELKGPNFHANYADMVVAEYGDPAVPGVGVREAYLIAGERAASEADHGVIEGTAPPGATLRLHKQFETPTCEDSTCAQGNGPSFTDVLETRLTAPGDGSYEWHVNPSGRPLHPDETWTMSCQIPGGTEVSTQVAVDRGQRVTVDWVPSCGPAAAQPGDPPPGTAPPPDGTNPPPTAARECRGETVTIPGGSGDDRLRGTPGADVIFARGGDDRIKAGGGADIVCAGAGADLAKGGGGADRLFGGRGVDRISGGPGADKCGDASRRDKVRSCG